MNLKIDGTKLSTQVIRIERIRSRLGKTSKRINAEPHDSHTENKRAFYKLNITKKRSYHFILICI